MDKYTFDEEYIDYEDQLLAQDRRARRHISRKAKPKPKREQPSEFLAMKDDRDELTFNPSYMYHKPDNQERQWLIKHLQNFYEEEYLIDVLSLVKSGKEASVYCCEGHPTLGIPYVAAKIYRPAIFRSLKNDAIYREGRYGKRESSEQAERLMDGRTARAIDKRTGFGKKVRLGTWIGHEYEMMAKLYAVGVHLPQPIGHKGQAILMSFVGYDYQAAPPLHYVTLEKDEAQQIFDQLLQDIVTMLTHDCIHGDLSAYNILYWQGQGMIIDFPQAVTPFYNQSAYRILERDIVRLCQYFSLYQVVDAEGLPPNPTQIATELWKSYMNNELV